MSKEQQAEKNYPKLLFLAMILCVYFISKIKSCFVPTYVCLGGAVESPNNSVAMRHVKGR